MTTRPHWVLRLTLVVWALSLSACQQILGDYKLLPAEPSDGSVIADAAPDRPETMPLRDAGDAGDAGDARADARPDGDAGDAQMPEADLPPVLAIDPTTKDFKEVVRGNHADATFDISNQGGGMLGVPVVSLEGEAGAGDFTVFSNGCVAALAPGVTCSITVRFTPSATGPESVTLRMDASPGGTVSVPLSGTGIPQGALSIVPSNQDFASIVVGSQSAPITFTVTNTGQTATSTLTTQVDNTDFEFADDTCGGKTLDPGVTCTISVLFAPSAAGQKGGDLVVSASTGGSTSSNLTGMALRPAQLTLAAAAQGSTDFGNVVVGITRDQTYVLKNSGQQTSGVVSVALAPSPSEFAILAATTGDCTATTTLAPNATCNVRIRFTPPIGGGARAAMVTASASPGGAATLALTANGQTPAVLSMTPAAASFSNVLLTASRDLVLTLTNGGQQDSGPIAVGALPTGYRLLA
ncbi:MAG TPA: choice-of-anchor D domain-containing protein, partial [Polyangiaceae bacterium]